MREVCSESFTAIKGSTQDLPQWFGMYPQDSVRGESPGLSFISCRNQFIVSTTLNLAFPLIIRSYPSAAFPRPAYLDGFYVSDLVGSCTRELTDCKSQHLAAKILP